MKKTITLLIVFIFLATMLSSVSFAESKDEALIIYNEKVQTLRGNKEYHEYFETVFLLLLTTYQVCLETNNFFIDVAQMNYYRLADREDLLNFTFLAEKQSVLNFTEEEYNFVYELMKRDSARTTEKTIKSILDLDIVVNSLKETIAAIKVPAPAGFEYADSLIIRNVQIIEDFANEVDAALHRRISNV